MRYYARLLTIRHKYPAIARGDYEAVITSHRNLGGFTVTYGEDSLVILHNNSLSSITYDLATCTDLDGVSYSTVCEIIGVGNAKLEGTVLTLAPQTSIILN